MRWLLAIDDTDNGESIGTGRLARMLAAHLEEPGFPNQRIIVREPTKRSQPQNEGSRERLGHRSAKAPLASRDCGKTCSNAPSEPAR